MLGLEAGRCEFRGENQLGAGAVLRSFPPLSLFHRYWDLSTKSRWIKFVLILNEANQEHERQNFTVKKYRSSNQQRKRRSFTGDEWTYRRKRHPTAVAHKKTRALKNGRGKVCFCLLSWRIWKILSAAVVWFTQLLSTWMVLQCNLFVQINLSTQYYTKKKISVPMK